MRVLDWAAADAANRRAVLRRPAQAIHSRLQQEAGKIVAAVRARGDAALREYTQRFDNAAPVTLQVTAAEQEAALANLDGEILSAIQTAIGTLTQYHRAGMQND